MSAKEFFVKLPYFCKASNAARCSRRNALIWEDEKNNPDGVFAKNDGDVRYPFNRITMAYDFDGDSNTIDYCMRLGELLLLSHEQLKHGEDHALRIEKLWEIVTEQEVNYPEISAVLSVEQALKGVWED